MKTQTLLISLLLPAMIISAEAPQQAQQKTLAEQSKKMPPTLKVREKESDKHSVYQLLPDGRKAIESLLARKPDEDIKAGITLEPSAVLKLNNIEYMIEPDSVILGSKEGTKIWRQKGIMEDLIRHSKLLKE